jgi:very-short-patch-repair endonuclease
MTDENFLVTAILKGMMEDKNYAITVTTVFSDAYFDDPAMSEIFKYTKKHIVEHKNIPERDIIINSISKDVRDEALTLFQECDSTDFSVSRNYDWLIDKTDQYLKDKAIKKAILDGIDIIDSGENIHEIRDIVESALCKTLKLDIGLNYFEELAERLKRILNSTDNRVKTYYHTFDELFSGGFPPYTLNMFIAKVHGHKCVCHDTYITIKDNDGNIDDIKIGDLYKYFYGNEYKGGINMPSLDVFKNKYGEEEGKKRYDEWRSKISKSSNGVSKLKLFKNKYGEEEGKKRYDEWRSKCVLNGKKSSNKTTLNGYLERYGEEEGKKRYDERCYNLSKSLKGINSLKWYQERYGEEEGKKRYDEWRSKISEKGRTSLKWYQERYGEEEGKKRYDEYISKQKHSHSLNGYLERYGEEEGKKRWNMFCANNSKQNTLNGYLERYGEEEGKKRYDERQKKWLCSIYSKSDDELETINRKKIHNGITNGYSKISQKLFSLLYDEIKNDYSDIRFATLNNGDINDNGVNNEKFIVINNKCMFVDFYIGDTNKIIEFDGDYWHGIISASIRDKERDDILTTNGYSILRIKECDLKNNCCDVIKNCLRFIYGD